MSLTLATVYTAAQSPQAAALAHLIQENVQEILGKALKQLGVSASKFKIDGNPYDMVSEDGSKNLGFILERGFGKLAKTILSENKDESGIEDGAETDYTAMEASPGQRDKWISEIYKLSNYLRNQLGMGAGPTGVTEALDGKIESAAEFKTAVGALLKQTLGQEYDGFSAVSAEDSAAAIINKNQDDLSPEQLLNKAIKEDGLHGEELYFVVGGQAWKMAEKYPTNSEKQLGWLELYELSITGIKKLNEAAHTR